MVNTYVVHFMLTRSALDQTLDIVRSLRSHLAAYVHLVFLGLDDYFKLQTKDNQTPLAFGSFRPKFWLQGRVLSTLLPLLPRVLIRQVGPRDPPLYLTHIVLTFLSTIDDLLLIGRRFLLLAYFRLCN